MIFENEIASKILNICFDIHKQYGPGLFESVYEKILCYELGKAGLDFVVSMKLMLFTMVSIWIWDLRLML